MGKTKKHVLTFEQTYDFQMIGICSHHNDYRVAWALNEGLGIFLSKAEEEYVMVNKKGVKLSQHSLYEYRDTENLIEYYLIKNKSLGKHLIPEKPVIDYFLFLVENYLFEPEELIDKLRTIPSVLGSFVFDPEEFESTELMVFN
ncbi:MAG: IPExxxVDY family protein [Cryomorphaceae bacterium]|nr:IPExxxVDY family protein [Cryomorphaceae bacterium]